MSDVAGAQGRTLQVAKLLGLLLDEAAAEAWDIGDRFGFASFLFASVRFASLRFASLRSPSLLFSCLVLSSLLLFCSSSAVCSSFARHLRVVCLSFVRPGTRATGRTRRAARPSSHRAQRSTQTSSGASSTPQSGSAPTTTT